MSPRAVSALVDLAIWGLPLYLLCAAVVSRASERRRRRAVATARAVTPPVQPSNVSVWRDAPDTPEPLFDVYLGGPRADMTDDEMARLLDDWSAPEQRGPSS